jgi:hypothetical protein
VVRRFIWKNVIWHETISFEDLGMLLIICSIVVGHKKCMFTNNNNNLYLVTIPHPSLDYSSSWFAWFVWIKNQDPRSCLWRIITLSMCKLGFFIVLIINVCWQVVVHSLLQANETWPLKTSDFSYKDFKIKSYSWAWNFLSTNFFF